LHSVPLPGVLGVATGAIAIGTVGTLRSTTIIITTRTTISTATSIAKVATGSIIRNTGETRLMGTGKRRINSVVKVLAALAEPVVREALAELVELAA